MIGCAGWAGGSTRLTGWAGGSTRFTGMVGGIAVGAGAAAGGAAGGMAAEDGTSAAADGTSATGAGTAGCGLESGSGATAARLSDHAGIGFSGVGDGPLISDDGGQAGMLSVGGSGGQTSVSAGGAVSFSSAGGHVCCAASEAVLRSGLVIGAGSLGVPSEPGWVGTVCAQSGADFCIGTAVLGFDSSTGGV